MNPTADLVARLPDTLPPELRREVEAALCKKHRPELLPTHGTSTPLDDDSAGTAVASSTTTTLTLSAIKANAMEQLRAVDMLVASQRLRALYEARSASVPRTSGPVVLDITLSLRDPIPCVIFQGTYVVLIDTVLTLGMHGVKACGAGALRVTMISLHFAVDGPNGPGPMHTQSCVTTDVSWVPDHVDGAAVPAALPSPPRGRLDASWHARLDCYARPMTHMGVVQLLLAYNGRAKCLAAAEALLRDGLIDRATVTALRRGRRSTTASDEAVVGSEVGLTFPEGPWAVLGLGGGCISAFLGASLPASVTVTSVELEPSVALVNRMHLGYPHRGNMPLIVADAAAVLADATRFPPASQVGVVLDCFDPAAMTMLCAKQLLQACWNVVQPGGVLMVNSHEAPGAEGAMAPFVEVCGPDVLYHVLSIPQYGQALIVVVKSPVKEDQAVSLWDYRAAATLFSNRHLPLRMASSGEPVNRVAGDVEALVAGDSTFRGGWLDGGCFSTSRESSMGRGAALAAVACRQWTCQAIEAVAMKEAAPSA